MSRELWIILGDRSKMNLKQLKEVMIKYGKAWENQDSDLILDCFTKNGIYQESPLAEPYKGHGAIKKFWDKVVGEETKNIKFKLGKCYISQDRQTGFAEWECRNNYKGKRNIMVGIMILKMKGNKITFLNEYWNSK
jgi:ketosteroid isomerase-like protein